MDSAFHRSDLCLFSGYSLFDKLIIFQASQNDSVGHTVSLLHCKRHFKITSFTSLNNSNKHFSHLRNYATVTSGNFYPIENKWLVGKISGNPCTINRALFVFSCCSTPRTSIFFILSNVPWKQHWDPCPTFAESAALQKHTKRWKYRCAARKCPCTSKLQPEISLAFFLLFCHRWIPERFKSPFLGVLPGY